MLFFPECPGFHVKRSKLCVEEKLKACGKKKISGEKNATYFSPCKKCSYCYCYLFAIKSSLGTVSDKNILSPECISVVQVSSDYSFLADCPAPLVGCIWSCSLPQDGNSYTVLNSSVSFDVSSLWHVVQTRLAPRWRKLFRIRILIRNWICQGL